MPFDAKPLGERVSLIGSTLSEIITKDWARNNFPISF